MIASQTEVSSSVSSCLQVRLVTLRVKRSWAISVDRQDLRFESSLSARINYGREQLVCIAYSSTLRMFRWFLRGITSVLVSVRPGAVALLWAILQESVEANLV